MLATMTKASAGLESVLQVPTDSSSEISTAETVANNQVQIKILIGKGVGTINLLIEQRNNIKC
ncbi:hypothetical protein MKX01_008522, partial [Papaver californicum]